jgi:uncharacterized protein
MKSNPVVHFEIYVDDMTRAKAFYEAVLAVKLEPMPNPTPEVDMEMCFFPMDKVTGMNSYGTGGALVKAAGFAPGNGGAVVYFGCEDCGVQVALSAAHGGRIYQDKMSIGSHGFCAMVHDTEGNLIGFHSMQ